MAVKKKRSKKIKPWTKIAIVKEEKFEDTLGSLEVDPAILALAAALEKPNLDDHVDFSNPIATQEKPFDESQYSEILDQLTLLDRVRYLEIL